MKTDGVEKIGLYFRGFFAENRNNQIELDKLGLPIKEEIIDDNFQVFSTLKVCNIQPTSNSRKIKFKQNENGIQYDFEYPIYFFKFKQNDNHFVFISLPNVKLFDLLFHGQDLIFSKSKLSVIFASFYQYENPPYLTLSRSNYKLNYDEDDSVLSISLFGKNNLQSNVIRDFLKLYPKNSKFDNPFKEEHAVFEPKSCRLNFSNTENAFSLNMDSSGNYSFFLNDVNQFRSFYNILKFIIDSDAFVQSELSPLTRSEASLKKSE